MTPILGLYLKLENRKYKSNTKGYITDSNTLQSHNGQFDDTKSQYVVTKRQFDPMYRQNVFSNSHNDGAIPKIINRDYI